MGVLAAEGGSVSKFAQGFIYVANPYTHSDVDVMEARYSLTAAYVAAKMQEGEILYSPIVHHHHMALEHKLPHDWPFWRNIDGNMLASARGMRVLKLDGWEKSVGVQSEIAIALALGIPVEYVESM